MIIYSLNPDCLLFFLRTDFSCNLMMKDFLLENYIIWQMIHSIHRIYTKIVDLIYFCYELLHRIYSLSIITKFLFHFHHLSFVEIFFQFVFGFPFFIFQMILSVLFTWFFYHHYFSYIYTDYKFLIYFIIFSLSFFF